IDLILGSDPIQLNPVVLFFVAPVIAVLYFALSTDLTGRTPGKWLMGLRVVRMSGGDITLGRALLRSLGYIVSLIPLGAGFLWVLVDDERRGWHDHIAGTKVQHQPGKVLARHTEP
ncbi:MAG TPA: RDD family protein, partial [Acidimicrobiia bacterium]|nr:RDD family protein [Acidimicrobiia bacterium]